MKTYKSITQDWAGQLLARYGVVDHTWNVELDFDVLQDYAVYPYEWIASWLWTFVAEYLPAKNCFWVYNSLEEALESVRERVNKKNELTEKTNEKIEQFQKVVTNNSLDERYRDKKVEKKVKTNEELKAKYAPYSKFEENAKKLERIQSRIASRLSADYYERLAW